MLAALGSSNGSSSIISIAAAAASKRHGGVADVSSVASKRVTLAAPAQLKKKKVRNINGSSI